MSFTISCAEWQYGRTYYVMPDYFCSGLLSIYLAIATTYFCLDLSDFMNQVGIDYGACCQLDMHSRRGNHRQCDYRPLSRYWHLFSPIINNRIICSGSLLIILLLSFQYHFWLCAQGSANDQPGIHRKGREAHIHLHWRSLLFCIQWRRRGGTGGWRGKYHFLPSLSSPAYCFRLVAAYWLLNYFFSSLYFLHSSV